MTPVEEFKLFLLRHDLELSPALDIVRMNPKLLTKYSMEEIAFLSTYISAPLKPVQKQFKMRPLLFNCCQLMAMKEKKSLIDWLDSILLRECKDLFNAEVLIMLADYNRKISG